MTLPCQRRLFEIPDDVAYLNCAYMSPLLRRVREAGELGVGRKAQPWRISTADFFEEPERLRALVARLVGGDADGVALIPSVSYGVAVAAANLPLPRKRHIVLMGEEFPSDVYAWRDLAPRGGAEIVTVPRPHDYDWTRAVLERIDERTGVVVVSNVHWTDGGLLDLVRVAERVRAVGAALVVDATQSLGAYPLDVAEVRPDFLVTAAYKWLLGPYSLGYLWVAPEHRGGRPLEQTWLGRAGSEDFGRLVEYRDQYQPGARRYDVGQRSNFALLPMAIAGLEQLLEWGVGQIRDSLNGLTALVQAEAELLGLEAAPAAHRAEHIIGLRARDGLRPDLSARLAAEGVYVSVRGDAIRVSPHLYNTEGDVRRLFEVLARVM